MIFLAFASVSTRLVVLGASVLALRYRAPEILFGCEDYSLGSEPRMQSSSQSFISFCTGAYTMFSLLVLASFIYIYIFFFLNVTLFLHCRVLLKELMFGVLDAFLARWQLAWGLCAHCECTRKAGWCCRLTF